ncbi:pH-gated potassium channel KcsA [Pseudovibrio axinellae]|uniref:pH-gated potassium channel KcsA n=1 Tax=Pseudovibrio axinellae TaxID=989403 RepID=A0A166ADN6_9HYPH|nr:ion transporter [Pseudovibrio axinellae]KZL20935.1 pH-gated potassium channel KcsA [Pseudovibrio axinellae]SEP82409.1 voltage-gated potassium channel [Pseudovibrio axinellae]
MNDDTSQANNHLFDLFILALSVYVIAALILQESMVLDTETIMLLIYADTAVCGVFFIEFLIRFIKADNKLAFIKWGWIDLIASIPMVDPLRYGRIIRLFRIIRALRASHSIIRYIFDRRTNSALTLVFISSLLMIILAAIAALQVEKSAEGANILHLKDAIWWAFVTVTTVGYGDFYPVTLEGRIIAAFLMTVGVGLFASLTGTIVANFFRHSESEKDQVELQALL